MLFAQSGSPSAAPPIVSAWLFALGTMIVVLIAAILVVALVVLYLRHSRKLLHAERMRSIEMGHPLREHPMDESQSKFVHNAFWIAFWTGFGVPAAAFQAAGMATTNTKASLALGIVIWVAAAAASIAGIICAGVLMLRCRQGNEAVVTDYPPAKPPMKF